MGSTKQLSEDLKMKLSYIARECHKNIKALPLSTMLLGNGKGTGKGKIWKIMTTFRQQSLCVAKQIPPDDSKDLLEGLAETLFYSAALLART